MGTRTSYDCHRRGAGCTTVFTKASCGRTMVSRDKINKKTPPTVCCWGGQSPCAADADEVGLCATTPRKIAKCGYCVVCHRDAMRTCGLPMQCTSDTDHRVDLPSDFVPRPQPEPRQQAQPEEEQPAAQGGDEDAAVMAEVMASSPPPGPPPSPLDEGDDVAIVGHQKSLQEARYERRLQAKDG